jgi:alpha-N-arabinofuranosidase
MHNAWTSSLPITLTAAYHAFEMNKGHYDATSIPVHLSAPARMIGDKPPHTLSMSASTKDGRSLSSLTNLEAEVEQMVTIELRGGHTTVTEARILPAPRLQDHNSRMRPAAMAPHTFDGVTQSGQTLLVELPTHALVTIELAVAG